jgi:NitT/TauT family transport system substrate-binding protein
MAIMFKTMFDRILSRALTGIVVAGGLLMTAAPADAQTKIKILLDWAWLPYHSPFVIAQAKGYYTEAGLDATIEQGRGSASTALIVSQGSFDVAHVNITNAAQMIGKGGPIKVVHIYQHKSGASFVGIKGKVKLDAAKSLIGPKIGSTPGGSDGLSIKIFSKLNKIEPTSLNIISMDANTKTVALFSDRIDLVSGDAPAFHAYVKDTGQEPVSYVLADHGVPLIGFGFAVNETYLKNNGPAVTKFLAATRRAFIDAYKDPKGACELMKTKVELAGTMDRCVNYFNNLAELSTKPDDPNWGRQTEDEWVKLTGTLREVGELEGSKPASGFYTNDYLPK